MKAELQKKLQEKYPVLFKDSDMPPTHSLMCFGLEVGDGWYQLLDELFAKITALDTKKEVVLMQVKEKFGGLRCYIGGAPDEIHDAIYDAEEKSFTICELCGQPGKAQDGGWIKTLCTKCNDA